MRLAISLRTDRRPSLQPMKAQRRKILGISAYWALASPGIEFSLDSLSIFHERKDDLRNVGIGPEHDWSSHAADALGLMAICYEAPGRAGTFNRTIEYAERGWR